MTKMIVEFPVTVENVKYFKHNYITNVLRICGSYLNNYPIMQFRSVNIDSLPIPVEINAVKSKIKSDIIL